MRQSIEHVYAALLPMGLSYSNDFKEQDTFILLPSKILGYRDRSHGISALYFCAWKKLAHSLMGSAYKLV